MSVIRDKQEAIKSFLSAEESSKTPVQANKVQQPKTLVEIEEEPENESVVSDQAAAVKTNANKAAAAKKSNDFIVEIKTEKKFNVKSEPMDSLVSSTTSFNNELEREGMFDAKSNNEDSGSDLGGVQQPFMKRSGLQRSTENVNSLASDQGSTATNGHGGDQDDGADLTSNGHHHDHEDVKKEAATASAVINGDETSKGNNFDEEDVDDASQASFKSIDEQHATKPASNSRTVTNGNNESAKNNNNDLTTSVDEDMKTLLINNGKQASAVIPPRPNLSSSKKTNGGAPTSAAAASTNKLAFAGAGISNADEKELRERERAHLERISLLEDENEKFK